MINIANFFENHILCYSYGMGFRRMSGGILSAEEEVTAGYLDVAAYLFKPLFKLERISLSDS